MLRDQQKDEVLKRLRRIEGQVGGIHRMIDEDKYCIDVLIQFAAVQGAMGQVSRIILSNHIDTCIREAFEHGDQTKHDRMIEELMDVFARYAKVGPFQARGSEDVTT